MLAGGGSLGAAQAAALCVLLEAGERFDMVVGTSAGAINAAFFAGDPTVEGARRLQAIWRTVRRRDVMAYSPRCLWNLAMRRGHVFELHGLRALLTKHIRYTDLADAAIPLHIIATELLSGDEVVLSSGPAVEAVLASASIPGVYPPVAFEGRMLVDGGICNNAPISAAFARGATRIFVVPTGFACALSKPPIGAAARAMHAIGLLISRQLVTDIEHFHGRAEIHVVPSICPLDVSSYDYSRANWLIGAARTIALAWVEAGGCTSSEIPDSLREHHH